MGKHHEASWQTVPVLGWQCLPSVGELMAGGWISRTVVHQVTMSIREAATRMVDLLKERFYP